METLFFRLPIAYTISFPKMCSFHTLQKNPAKVRSEPDY